MREYTLFILSLFFIIIVSCSNDEKAIDLVTNNISRGTILRNVERLSSNFINSDTSSRFELLVEQQGEVFDFLRLHIKYIDRDEDGIGIISEEVIFRNIEPNEFYNGPLGLPRILLSFSYQEVLEALFLDEVDIIPGDQFEIRAEIFLEDGRSFSNDSAGPTILGDGGFFKSPFRYVINVIEPIADSNFTGVYFYEVLSEQKPNSTFFSGNASISYGGEHNNRIISLPGLSTTFSISGSFI